MRNLFDDWNWNDTLGVVFTAFLISMVTLIVIAVSSEHRVRNYYLDSNGTALAISADINWEGDQVINLDRSVSYEEAVKLVNELNAGIPAKDLNLPNPK